MIDPMIIEAHEWLEKEKILNRVSYKKLGAPIGYSDTGMIRAIKKSTLSIVQIQKIAEDFKFDVRNVSFIKNDTNSVSDADIDYDIDHKRPKNLSDSQKIDAMFKIMQDLKCEVAALRGAFALKGLIELKEKGKD